MTYCYSHRLEHTSTSSEKILPVNSDLERGSQLYNTQRVRYFPALSTKWDVSINALPLKFRNPYERRGRKIVRDRGEK